MNTEPGSPEGERTLAGRMTNGERSSCRVGWAPEGACGRGAGGPRPVRHAPVAPEARRPHGRRRHGRGPNWSSSPRRSSAATRRGTTSASASASAPRRAGTSSAAYFESAIEVPGPATEFIGSVARDHGVHLVVGVIERDGGTLYCTALIFGPDGSLLGKHRKLMPTAMERVIWGSGDGSTLPGRRHAARQDRVGDLLGELHAPAADGDVRQGGRVVLRRHRGRPGDVGADRAAHRPRRPLLRPVGVPVLAAGRPAARLPHRSGSRPRPGRADPGRQLHRRAARANCWPGRCTARSAC